MSASTPPAQPATRGGLDELLRVTAAELTSLEGGPTAVVVGVRAASGDMSLGAAGSLPLPSGGQIATPTDAVFDLASVSKVLGTTAAVAALYGQLELDRPVLHYLPRAGLPDSVTPRDLLTHRAGLWDWQPLYLAPAGAAAALDALALRYRPGEARYYSDLGFMHLGRLVAAVAGEDYAAAVRHLVLDPLGMRSTTMGGSAAPHVVPAALGDSVEWRMVATGNPYPIVIEPRREDVPWRTGVLRGEVNDGNAFHGRMVGHAGLFAPVADMLRGAAALMGAPHSAPELAPQSVLTALRTVGPDAAQALGWRYETFSGVPLWWHPGFTGCAVGVGKDAAVALGTNRLLGAGPDAPLPTAELWGRTIRRLTAEGVLTGGDER